MVRPGRMLWCWELDNPCAGSAIADLPGPLSLEEARTGCKGEKSSSYCTKCHPVPREAIRMSPNRSMSAVVLHLRAWRWEQVMGAGRMGIICCSSSGGQ